MMVDGSQLCQQTGAKFEDNSHEIPSLLFSELEMCPKDMDSPA